MSIGPIELVMVRFPGNQLRGHFADMVPILKDLVDSRTIRVIDLLILRKDANGKADVVELTSLDDAEISAFRSLVDEVLGVVAANGRARQRLSRRRNVVRECLGDALPRPSAQCQRQLVAIERVPKSVIDQVQSPPVIAGSGSRMRR